MSLTTQEAGFMRPLEFSNSNNRKAKRYSAAESSAQWCVITWACLSFGMTFRVVSETSPQLKEQRKITTLDMIQPPLFRDPVQRSRCKTTGRQLTRLYAQPLQRSTFTVKFICRSETA